VTEKTIQLLKEHEEKTAHLLTPEANPLWPLCILPNGHEGDCKVLPRNEAERQHQGCQKDLAAFHAWTEAAKFEGSVEYYSARLQKLGDTYINLLWLRSGGEDIPIEDIEEARELAVQGAEEVDQKLPMLIAIQPKTILETDSRNVLVGSIKILLGSLVEATMLYAAVMREKQIATA
jgi:hypothetical protein